MPRAQRSNPMRRIIAITGTPGSGKTRIAGLVSRKIKGSHLIDVNQIIKEKRLFSSYSADGAMVVKMKALQRELEKEIKKLEGTVILEGHILCDLKLKGATAIVIREHLPTIKSRLIKRGYIIAKIRDNLISEATDYCGDNSRKNYAEAFEVLNDRNAVKEITGIIEGKKKPKRIEMIGELPSLLKEDIRYVIG